MSRPSIPKNHREQHIKSIRKLMPISFNINLLCLSLRSISSKDRYNLSALSFPHLKILRQLSFVYFPVEKSNVRSFA